MKRLLIGLMAGSLALFTAACGGGAGSSAPTSSTSSTSSSPLMMTAGDAPLTSIVSATVTISSVALTSSTGSTVQVLQKPHAMELSALGAVRAPLELDSVPVGSYTSVAITVTAANVVYLDPTTGAPTPAQATINQGTATLALNPPLTIAAGVGSDLNFDFDLAKSLDLTNGVVTFTPVIAAAGARVDQESNDERDVTFRGSITAINGTSITVTTLDGNLPVTVDIGSSTKFSGGLSLSALTTGSVVRVEGQVQTDGTVLATSIEAAENGKDDGHDVGGAGIVTSVTTDSSGNLTAFQMVFRESLDNAQEGKVVTVQLGSGTVFKMTDAATAAGMTTWDATQIVPGQGVFVVGAPGSDDQSAAAAEIRPAPITAAGLLATVPQGGVSAGSFTLNLQLDASSPFAKLLGIANSVLIAQTNAATVVDGNGLASSGLSTLAQGTPLEIRGYLGISQGAFTLFATHVHEVSSQN